MTEHTRNIGILLANLGSPDAPAIRSVRKYLAEFLWDPRIVQLPRPLWWLILHGIILRIRPARSARAYAKVWTDEGSPLICISQAQARAVQEQLDHFARDQFHVALGMRYGKPSIASALTQLRDRNVSRLLVLPLYPQFSSATTASTFDAVAATFHRWVNLPELRMLTHYADEPDYIETLASSIREAWERRSPGEKLLFSFHGMPERTHRAGDPYYEQCLQTATDTAARLGLSDKQWQIAFQSRFGSEKWLQPYTDRQLKKWARQGVKDVDVVCPAFAADCLETLEEIALQNRELFLRAGGKELRYIPALNTRPDHIRLFVDLILKNTRDWVPPPL